MKHEYTCKNEECEHEFEVNFTPETPATGMSGLPEHYDPGSEAECDPFECPKCGEEVNIEEVEEDCTPDPDDYQEFDR